MDDIKWEKNTRELTKGAFEGKPENLSWRYFYVCYEAALEMCHLTTLSGRRGERGFKFAIKCLKNPVNKRFFPLNPITAMTSTKKAKKNILLILPSQGP